MLIIAMGIHSLINTVRLQRMARTSTLPETYADEVNVIEAILGLELDSLVRSLRYLHGHAAVRCIDIVG